MADVDTKSGTYTVRAHASGRLGDPESTFTFWWGNDAKPTEYFDVSIEPNPAFLPMMPLEETHRQYTMAPSTHRQPMVIVTLSNPNDFDVQFFANHVRAL
jgi:hypothetical protein